MTGALVGVYVGTDSMVDLLEGRPQATIGGTHAAIDLSSTHTHTPPAPQGAYFGERALLKNEARFAGIRATTKLKTLSISRDEFERVIGPLADYSPDSH